MMLRDLCLSLLPKAKSAVGVCHAQGGNTAHCLNCGSTIHAPSESPRPQAGAVSGPDARATVRWNSPTYSLIADVTRLTLGRESAFACRCAGHTGPQRRESRWRSFQPLPAQRLILCIPAHHTALISWPSCH